MAVKPKYMSEGLRAASERPFVGRDDLQSLFNNTLKTKKSDQHKVLVFYGVAGIGKSLLQPQLALDLAGMFAYPAQTNEKTDILSSQGVEDG
jgi:hypothetical protein